MFDSVRGFHQPTEQANDDKNLPRVAHWFILMSSLPISSKFTVSAVLLLAAIQIASKKVDTWIHYFLSFSNDNSFVLVSLVSCSVVVIITRPTCGNFAFLIILAICRLSYVREIANSLWLSKLLLIGLATKWLRILSLPSNGKIRSHLVASQ